LVEYEHEDGKIEKLQI
jgi:cytochrome P450